MLRKDSRYQVLLNISNFTAARAYLPTCWIRVRLIDEHYYVVGLISGTYHFRFKQPFQGKFVWMDVTDDHMEVRQRKFQNSKSVIVDAKQPVVLHCHNLHIHSHSDEYRYPAIMGYTPQKCLG